MMISDAFFCKRITDKYGISAPQHRCFPLLIFLFIKPFSISISLLQKNAVVYNFYRHYYENYYLNQVSPFTVSPDKGAPVPPSLSLTSSPPPLTFLTFLKTFFPGPVEYHRQSTLSALHLHHRGGDITLTRIRERDKQAKTTPVQTIQHIRQDMNICSTHRIQPVFSSLVFPESLQHYWKTTFFVEKGVSLIPGRSREMPGKENRVSFTTLKLLRESHDEGKSNQFYIPGNSTAEIVREREVKEAAAIKVNERLKPFTHHLITTPISISNRFNDSLTVIHQPRSLVPQDSQQTGSIPVTGKQGDDFFPLIIRDSGHHGAVRAVLEEMRKRVAGIEKRVVVNEEQVTASVSANKNSAAVNSGNFPTGPAGEVVDMNRLTDRVYRLLERKIMIEKERRGV